ncbi:MAG: hypothetical protein VXW32_02135 [Myxococcota bacterium]|nr:hypothetical protein [Myxococcota bacterium]
MMNRLTLPKLACPALMFLWACGPSSSEPTSPAPSAGTDSISADITRSEQAGELARKDPKAALELCGALSNTQLKDDCFLSTVRYLVKSDAQAAQEVCSTLAVADECFFRLAETLREPDLCERSGKFEDNCRLHVLSFGLQDWIAPEQEASEVAQQAPKHILAAGFRLEDERPWIAIWRWVLSQSVPLDRAPCRSLGSEFASRTCLEAGAGLFHDQLSQARDRGLSVCEGPLPESLQPVRDPQLDDALARRRSTDLCDPTARRSAPDALLPGSAR